MRATCSTHTPCARWGSPTRVWGADAAACRRASRFGLVAVRVVVTGGAGFVGSHLCDRLLANGHEVVCVDNLITGKREHAEMLSTHHAFSFLESNISEPFEV